MEVQHAHRTASQPCTQDAHTIGMPQFWITGMDVCAVCCVIACHHSTTYSSCSTAYVLLSRITAPLVKGRVHKFAFGPLCTLCFSPNQLFVSWTVWMLWPTQHTLKYNLLLSFIACCCTLCSSFHHFTCRCGASKYASHAARPEQQAE